MTINDSVAIAVAFIIFLSEWIYIRSILKGITKPSRSTFWIWGAVQGLTAASYFMAGGGAAAALSASYAVAFLAIAILSIRYGFGEWTELDHRVSLAAALAVGAWIVTGSELLALFLLLTTDLLGAIPTIRKSMSDPDTEDRSAWALTLFATALNFGAVSQWGIEDLLYNPYLLLINGLIVFFVWRPVLFPRWRRKKAHASDKHELRAFPPHVLAHTEEDEETAHR